MSDTTDRRIPWLPIAGGGVVLIGILVLVMGTTSASGAKADREDAESAVALQRDAVAAAEQDLGGAESELAEAEGEASDAAADLAEAEAQQAATQSVLDTLKGEIPAFVLAASGAISDAAEVHPAISDIAARQHAQIEALLGDDYPTFNTLRVEFPEPTAAASDQIADFAASVRGLPEVEIAEPFTHVGPAMSRIDAGEPVELDPPTGPAVITAILPDQVDCDSWGNAGCHYSWTIRFEESNWLGVEITRIGVRYRRGSRYCILSSGEYSDVSVGIVPNGSNTWRNGIYIDRDGPCWREMGGELLVRWEGTDAEGNRLSGRVTSPMESPE